MFSTRLRKHTRKTGVLENSQGMRSSQHPQQPLRTRAKQTKGWCFCRFDLHAEGNKEFMFSRVHLKTARPGTDAPKPPRPMLLFANLTSLTRRQTGWSNVVSRSH
ncbi:hypothetical protein Y1Q_0019945 [Alligator mississippiensis]|uniref:Uncharacterized protein n=1 Tax=Alligator mississippiensis TaxID=8496 RepID=A0A151PEN8_ALLMI|nr:hypothetical protein Y1Q_0019945 [Alligator mississippiensis]